MEQINMSFIDFWAHICGLTKKNLSSPAILDSQQVMRKYIEGSPQHDSVMIDYFNNNAFDILQSLLLYLRRELKIHEYSQMFEENEEFKQKDFDQETKQLFEDNPHLIAKVEKIREAIILKIFQIIDQEGSEVRVSLHVYSSFKKLSNSDVRTEYRSLEMLRVKSSFDPTHN